MKMYNLVCEILRKTTSFLHFQGFFLDFFLKNLYLNYVVIMFFFNAASEKANLSCLVKMMEEMNFKTR